MSDALERLRNRQRPEVPLRDAALTPISIDTATPKSPMSDSVDTSMSRYQDVEVPKTQKSKGLEELKTKQSTMRLEAGISDRLQAACRVDGLSREVLIEALFLHCESDLQAWQMVITEAKRRADHRQQIANLRRAQSMMERFGNQ